MSSSDEYNASDAEYNPDNYDDVDEVPFDEDAQSEVEVEVDVENENENAYQDDEEDLSALFSDDGGDDDADSKEDEVPSQYLKMLGEMGIGPSTKKKGKYAGKTREEILRLEAEDEQEKRMREEKDKLARLVKKKAEQGDPLTKEEYRELVKKAEKKTKKNLKQKEKDNRELEAIIDRRAQHITYDGVDDEEEYQPSQYDKILGAVNFWLGGLAIPPVSERKDVDDDVIGHEDYDGIDTIDDVKDFDGEERLKKIWMIKDGNFELEIRLRSQGPNGEYFTGTNSGTEFKTIIDVLEEKFGKPKIAHIISEAGPDSIRKVDQDGKVIWQQKTKSAKPIDDGRIRISGTTEKPIIENQVPKNWAPYQVRDYTRRSYTPSRESRYYGWRFDVSSVTTTDLSTNKTRHTFEVEAERIDVKIKIETVEKVSEFLLTNISPFAIKTSESDRNNTVSKFNDLLGNGKSSVLFSNFVNKAHALKVDDLLGRGFDSTVTVKYDGQRFFLFFSRGKAYIVYPPHDIFLVSDSTPKELDGTLIDGELVHLKENSEPVYVMFDLLFNAGSDIRKKPLKSRLTFLSEIADSLEEVEFPFAWEEKKFYFENATPENPKGLPEDVYEASELALAEAGSKDYEFETDGLILQEIGAYGKASSFKWKPADLTTIDFRLGISGEENKFIPFVVKYDKGVPTDVPFKGNSKFPSDALVLVPGGKFEKYGNPAGLIAECSFSVVDGQGFWSVMRIRFDKYQPNEYGVALDTWESIQNPISEETMKGKTAQIYRRFHNLVKKEILLENVKKGSTILDIGSGRGGDLMKWKSLGLKTIYAVEPSSENCDEIERRIDSMSDSPVVDIIENEFENIREDHVPAVDAVVSFFSLTFFPKDTSTIKKFLKNLQRALPKKGSKFIGTVMDGKKVWDKIYKSMDGEIGNEIYKIGAVDIAEKKRATGDKIYVEIKDETSMVKYEEFLVYFDTFVKWMKQAGFKLESSSFLDENGPLPEKFDRLPIDSQDLSELFREFVFVRV